VLLLPTVVGAAVPADEEAVVPLFVADLLLLLHAADSRASAAATANHGKRFRVFCIKVRPPFFSL
jgi:hypothetical protein